MRFTIHCSDGCNDRKFYYDNETSVLTDDQGNQIIEPKAVMKMPVKPIPHTSKENPNGKVAEIKVLKIQLGLACNYACSYCSQRFVPRADESHPHEVGKFMRNIDLWLQGQPFQIEFWGGEPFAYWKTLKPLAEAIKAKFPGSRLLIITNGSLLNPEINQWIEDLDINVGISHDGPGQHVRGPDPLDDPEQRKHILDLIRRRKGKISFNTVMNRENWDRAKVQQFFRNVLGGEWVSIGEGQFVDPYDEGSEKLSIHTHEEALAFRNLTLGQIRRREFEQFLIMRRMGEWITTISSGRGLDVVWQKCGMDQPAVIAVDLKGNVLTCQNTSTVSKAPNGQPNRIGHVSQLDKVKLNTATHFANRPKCMECPIVQACKGTCMFLEGPRFEKACNNAYNDHLPFFAAAIERLTGYLPYYIESPSLPSERSELWEQPNG